MGDHSQVNLKEVEDQAKSFGLDGMEGRFPHGELGAGVLATNAGPNKKDTEPVPGWWSD